MSNYLGLYIEENLIKYAKVSKEKDKIKIEASGVKFYSNISQTIKQIVEETYSFKTPISINLTQESYQYFSMFSQLNKKDLEKSIQLEFDTYCTEKGYNSSSMETRYIINNIVDDGKVKVINISQNRIELTKLKQKLDGYKLEMIAPVSITVPNLINLEENENSLIVNIEDKTTITKIVDRNITEVIQLDEGSKEILDKINLKENSYSKAYEICQNTTIYTSEVQDFTEEQSKYLEDIMPTLYNIVGNVQKIINDSTEKISKVYITGTLSCVNNIDLYFQEYLGKVRCEILKPYFLQNLTKSINIKDYIEVNSAISLALQGLGEGIKGINFKKTSSLEKFINITLGSQNDGKKKNGKLFEFNDFKEKVTPREMWMIRCVVSLLLFIVIYSSFSVLLVNKIHDKQDETDTVKTKLNSQISRIEADTKILNGKTTQYTTLISDLQEINDKISDMNASKNLIPNLLNQIMNSIDETVQITSIQNTTGKHIVIVAQSPKYPGLGYFKTILKTKNILQNVVSGSSMKQGGVITVTIEGELP